MFKKDNSAPKPKRSNGLVTKIKEIKEERSYRKSSPKAKFCHFNTIKWEKFGDHFQDYDEYLMDKLKITVPASLLVGAAAGATKVASNANLFVPSLAFTVMCGVLGIALTKASVDAYATYINYQVDKAEDEMRNS